MADPQHAGFASHRPAAPNDLTWPLKIKDIVKVQRDPSAPDWHMPPARAMILNRNDAYVRANLSSAIAPHASGLS